MATPCDLPCHAKQNIMDADTGRELVIHWAGDPSTSFATLEEAESFHAEQLSDLAEGA